MPYRHPGQKLNEKKRELHRSVPSDLTDLTSPRHVLTAHSEIAGVLLVQPASCTIL